MLITQARLGARAFGVVAATLLAPQLSAAPALLNAMFQDHAVLQRDKPIAVWGSAAPGESVTLTLADRSVTTRSDSAGHWAATLPAMSAGGPYELKASTNSGAKQTASDVLIGDVYLCSGQSNMGMSVSRSANSYNDMANAANDSIRLMNIGLAINNAPQRDFASPVKWLPTTSESVGEFSATCFYFARELQKSVRVPLGLINSSWGGSKIEAWMSDVALRASGGDPAKLDVLKLYNADPAAGGARWGAIWESWWHSQSQTRGIADPWLAKANDSQWQKAPAGLGHWEKWGVPALESYTGMMWYRTSVTLTAQQAKQKAALAIGQVDEVDQTWVNGKPVGNAAGFGGDPHADGLLEANRQRISPARVYYLSSGVLKAGENIIVVNVLDTWGLGGLYGEPEQRALLLGDGSVLPLDREWRYQVAPPGMGSVPRAPWEAVAGLTTIRNAMIAPLGSYGIRGVVWYQGESNTDQADRYQGLLAGYMADGRKQFGADTPFLIVQLANYGSVATMPVESGTAGLRDAQRRAVAADGNAGLAIAVDIGDRYDIHPGQKQELGRRLARAARNVIYGETLPPSGPAVSSAQRDGARIVVKFAGVTGRLVTYSAASASGFELCGSQANSCRFVGAAVEGDRALLDASQSAGVTRVRFCWADSPVCNLYDEAALPAGPFEIAIDSVN
ncbi:MAG TPA: sialate O-acetylesterase [Povalibacter sp.]